MANKVKFGLKNAHYASLTFGEGGTPTFGTPVPIPGSVNLSLSRASEAEDFYADDGIYYEGGKDYWGFRHIRQIEDYYKAVEEKREPFISGKEALKIQKLICAIYESGKTGKTVTF